MSYTVILNACGHTLAMQAQEMRGFLKASGMATDGRAILLHTGDEPALSDLQEVPAAEIVLLRLAAYQPENALAALVDFLGKAPPPLLLFAGDYTGRELAVRLACRLGGSPLVGVTSLQQGTQGVVCTKKVYANNMQAELALLQPPACISAAEGRRTAADPGGADKTALITQRRDCTSLHHDSHVLSRQELPDAEGGGLADAPFVLAAGRGVKSREDTQKLVDIAAEMGAELGVSRPLAMNAWAELNRLIGVSGAMLAPKVCLAVGVSGAGAFLAGVEGAQHLIAVNTDPDAAIMQAADVAVVDSYEAILPELVKLIKRDRG